MLVACMWEKRSDIGFDGKARSEETIRKTSM
jgi:hypothetical protein